jgi:hypothetical protein
LCPYEVIANCETSLKVDLNGLGKEAHKLRKNLLYSFLECPVLDELKCHSLNFVRCTESVGQFRAWGERAIMR